MKKFLSFFVSLILSFLVFGLVGAAGILLAVLEGEPKADELPRQEKTPKMFDILSVYTDFEGSRYYASVVSFDLDNNEIVVESVDCSSVGENGKKLYEIFEQEGFYPYVSALKTAFGKGEMPFVQFSSESFIKNADRCKKLVYNYKDTEPLLLTGRQADEKLDSETFSIFCKIIAEDVLERGINQEFLYYSAAYPNDFSYPKFYNIVFD